MQKWILTFGFMVFLVGVFLLEISKRDDVVFVSPVFFKDEVVVAAPAQVEVVSGVESKIVSEDARYKILEKYLVRYNSPLLPYLPIVFEESQKNGLDWRLIVAIGQQESNLCKKIQEGSHNCWGYGIHSKSNLGFESYELAIKSFAAYLKRVYYDKGITEVDEIERKYNPTSYFGAKSWSFGVNQFMRELETGEF